MQTQARTFKVKLVIKKTGELNRGLNSLTTILQGSCMSKGLREFGGNIKTSNCKRRELRRSVNI